MIIADPFGSWVQGAREGTQDAISIRQAQDAAAANAYGLQSASQADPIRLQILRNQARLSDLNANTAQQVSDSGLPLQNARTASQTAQAALAAHLADYGSPGYLQQLSTGLTPGVQVGTHEGTQYVQTPITDSQGHGINTAYPVANIESPHAVNARLQAQHYNNQQDLATMKQQQLQQYRANEESRKMLGKTIIPGYNLLGKSVVMPKTEVDKTHPYGLNPFETPQQPSTPTDDNSDTYNFSEGL